MTSTRIPSEAELIELENWLGTFEDAERVLKQRPADDRKWTDDWKRWRDRLDEATERDVFLTRIRALLDLARTVRNP